MDCATRFKFTCESGFAPSMVKNDDGSLRRVLEHEVYEQGAGLFVNLIHKMYGPDQKVDIKEASSESSESSKFDLEPAKIFTHLHP